LLSYKTAIDLTVYLEQVVRNFSRYHKYTLGSDLRQQSCELVTMIIRVHSRRENVPVLYELRERLESLLVLLRIGQDVRRCFSLLRGLWARWLSLRLKQSACLPAGFFDEDAHLWV
jgi:hypothetical protein